MQGVKKRTPSHRPNSVRAITITALLLCCPWHSSSAKKRKVSDGRPTSAVVVEFRKLIREGALLNPSGWQQAARLFEGADPFPADGSIHVMSAAGIVGETQSDDSSAEVQSKWDDSYGTVDSRMRYILPKERTCGSISIYHLAKVRGTWKIKGRLTTRLAAIGPAIVYVTAVRDKTKNSVVRKNAIKTLVILKQQQGELGDRC